MSKVLIVFEFHSKPLTRQFIYATATHLIEKDYTKFAVEFDLNALLGLHRGNPLVEGREYDYLIDAASYYQHSMTQLNRRHLAIVPIDLALTEELRIKETREKNLMTLQPKIAAHRERIMLQEIERQRLISATRNENIIVVLGRSHFGIQHQLINYALEKGDLSLLDNYRFVFLFAQDEYHPEATDRQDKYPFLNSSMWQHPKIPPYPLRSHLINVDLRPEVIQRELITYLETPSEILPLSSLQRIARVVKIECEIARRYFADFQLLLEIYKRIDCFELSVEAKGHLKYGIVFVFDSIRQKFQAAEDLRAIPTITFKLRVENFFDGVEKDTYFARLQMLLGLVSIPIVLDYQLESRARILASSHEPASVCSRFQFFVPAVVVLVFALTAAALFFQQDVVGSNKSNLGH